MPEEVKKKAISAEEMERREAFYEKCEDRASSPRGKAAVRWITNGLLANLTVRS